MKKIIAKINFTANGKNYIAGEEIETTNYAAIVKLNENGFIEPLDFKDLVLIKKELDKPKDFKKKEETKWLKETDTNTGII